MKADIKAVLMKVLEPFARLADLGNEVPIPDYIEIRPGHLHFYDPKVRVPTMKDARQARELLGRLKRK